MQLSRLIYFPFLLSVVLRLALSNSLLNEFYPYTLRGGAWFQKIHPGSMLAIALLLVVILLRNPLKFVIEQFEHQREAFLFAVAVALVILFVVLLFGSGGAAYLVDTFAASAASLLLALYLSQHERRSFSSAILLIVVINSLVALAEFLFGFHVIKPEATQQFFRSTALFGHPLNNALLTVTCAIMAVKMHWNWVSKTLVISLMVLALVAYGARGSLASLMLGLAAYLVVVGLRRGRTIQARLGMHLAACLGLATAVSGVLYVVFMTSLGATIATRLKMDSSIQARFESISILERVNYGDVIWGIGQQQLDYLKHSANIVVIENFWVELLLRLGMPMFIFLCMSLIYFFYKTAMRGGWLDVLCASVFIAAASTNNSLSTKTPVLVVYMLLVVLTGYPASTPLPANIQRLSRY